MLPPALFAPLAAFDDATQVVRYVPEFKVRVLVAKLETGWYACVAKCPHGDVELDGMPIIGSNILCKGHNYQFDLRTGQCTHTRHLRLSLLAVTVRDDQIYVQLQPHVTVAP